MRLRRVNLLPFGFWRAEVLPYTDFGTEDRIEMGTVPQRAGVRGINIRAEEGAYVHPRMPSLPRIYRLTARQLVPI